jgi:hypothetical protein
MYMRSYKRWGYPDICLCSFVKVDEYSEDGSRYTCSIRGSLDKNVHELQTHRQYVVEYHYQCLTLCEAV